MPAVDVSGEKSKRATQFASQSLKHEFPASGAGALTKGRARLTFAAVLQSKREYHLELAGQPAMETYA